MSSWQTKDDADLLLDGLRELIAAQGTETFLAAELVEASSEFFPEPWDSSLVGASRLLQRFFHYVDELKGARWHIEVPETWLDTQETPPDLPAISFVGVDPDGAAPIFQVERLGSFEEVLGQLCLEVARAYLAIHELTASHPYRGRQDGAEDDDAASLSRRAAIATIYLGLGPISVAAADLFRKSGEQCGFEVVTHVSHLQVGGLPPGDLTFLFAVQLVVRGMNSTMAAPLLGNLPPNQATDVRTGWSVSRVREKISIAD